jgi:sulfonate transport system substrate-binding protein
MAGTTALAALAPRMALAADKTARVGYQKYGNLLLLKTRGFLEEALAPLGYGVEWREFQSGPPLMEALGAGAIDFGTAGETPPVFAQAAGAPLLYLATEPPAPRGEAILVHADSPIKTLADLRGKRVALNKGSNVHYLYVRALEAAGLRQEDVAVSYLAPPDGRAAFARGSVDAWVIWDPYLAAAQASLPTRVLADATGLASNHQFYLGSRRFTDKSVITAFTKAIERIDRETVGDPAAAAKILAPATGLPEPVLAVALARQSWDIKPIDAGIVAEQQKIADTFLKLGLIPKEVKISDAVAASPS